MAYIYLFFSLWGEAPKLISPPLGEAPKPISLPWERLPTHPSPFGRGQVRAFTLHTMQEAFPLLTSPGGGGILVWAIIQRVTLLSVVCPSFGAYSRNSNHLFFFAKLGRIHRFGKVNFATNFYQKQLFSEKSTFLMQGFTIFAFIE